MLKYYCNKIALYDYGLRKRNRFDNTNKFSINLCKNEKFICFDCFVAPVCSYSYIHSPSMLPFNSFPPIPALTSTSLLSRQLFQVRNAINALQELATTTNTVASNRFPFPLPAHSNPNIPRVRGNEGDAPLPRSSSHPPEMFCWEDNAERERLVSAETQTDVPLDYIRQFVLENRQLVLSWLDAKVCVFRETEQKNKSADWLMDPLPPPTLWNTQHHRFSAGDVTERTSQILYQHLPSSKSLKFHPYSWML